MQLRHTLCITKASSSETSNFKTRTKHANSKLIHLLRHKTHSVCYTMRSTAMQLWMQIRWLPANVLSIFCWCQHSFTLDKLTIGILQTSESCDNKNCEENRVAAAETYGRAARAAIHLQQQCVYKLPVQNAKFQTNHVGTTDCQQERNGESIVKRSHKLHGTLCIVRQWEANKHTHTLDQIELIR